MGDSQDTPPTPEEEQELLDQPTRSLPDAAPVSSLLQPGQLLGPYTIVGALGSGGMAHVYLGERADGTRAALKVLRTTEAEADRMKFLGSPSVRVNGVDIEPAARERTEFALSCRLYGKSGVPLKGLLVEALREGA